ncbi:glycosyltransferase [uncultured Holdemanella sp.]|jgi:lipopolysaccharide biosynthesis glycosyltransferase|uniref:glycosyltransferase n=1 Tax=uncultured Holdemanella sp. TaxID=1763549 RepID=UPI0025DF85C6|nr:glycosyltransferase [uncultured Holdemanella sp.]
MNVHITNIYGFIQDQELKKKQNIYADAAHALGFKEMGIFNFDVSTDTENELSKRIDGIISSLQFNDLVFIQLPTGNGEYYDNLLINKIKAYNTKVCILLHQIIEYEYALNAADLIMPTSNEVYAYLKERNYSNVFYKHNINYEFELTSNSSNILSSDFYIKKYLIDAVDQLEEPVLDEDVIHIGFGLHDKDGHYSVWVGTVMQSILEHTDSRICFHILHDETVSEENKRRLAQVAHQKGDVIEFHEINSAEFECIKDRTHGFTIGTMFRCMLPDLSKIVYLDADIFVNIDIKELWGFDISDYCLAAVADEGVIKFHIPNILYKYPEINRNQYFNAGVLCMNLKKIKQRGNLKDMVVEFLVNNPEATYPDQDALNVLFHNTILYLDSSWNQFVYSHREENIDTLKKGIYHFAADVLVLYSNSKIDMEYFKTLCRTPWSDYEIENRVDGCIGRLNDRINQYEKMIYRLSMPGVKHIFYGEENFMLRKLFDSINLSEDDYRVMKHSYNQDGDILPCRDLQVLKEEKGPLIIFVLYESDNFTAIQNLEELGFENGKDFFVVARFMSFLDGGFA